MDLLRSIILGSIVLSSLITVCHAKDPIVLSKKSQNSTISTNVFNRMCYSHPASYPSCSIGPFVPLSKLAPEPQTVGGRLLVKASAYMYTCYQRNMAACEKDTTCYWVDVDGYCTVSSSLLQSIRISTVCANSKADISASCAALTKDDTTCKSDTRCKWLPCSGSSCVRVSSSDGNTTASPTGLCLGNIADLISNDVSISSGVMSGTEPVWGCCDTQKLYVATKKCLDIGGSTLCSGGCQWDDMRNECAPTLTGQIGIWGNKETNFSTYLSTIDSQCNQATDFKCLAQPAVDIDPAKVKKYLGMKLQQIENTCPETLLSETPPSIADSMNTNGTTASVRFSGSSSSRPVAAVGVLVMGLALMLL